MWQQELATRLTKAKTRDRKGVIAEYQALHGYTKEHLYRIAKAHGFTPGRTPRKDKGVSSLTDGQIDYVAALIYKSSRENKGAIMPVENALEIAYDNQVIARGAVTVGHMQRLLRERELDAQRQNAPTPHTQMRSLHPNHVHEVDASVCIQYYLADGGLKVMREDEFYKNKLHNMAKIKQPLQRYVLTDHFSGFMFVKYYVSFGETAEILFDFLCSAWEAKADSRYPMHGAPFKMLMDGGSLAKAKAMGEGFWRDLDIDLPPGKTGNSRRQGAVECTHNIWERWFETRLRFDPASDVDDLNAKAFDFCTWFNATRKHTRHGMTRLSCWLMIKSEQLRVIPSRAELQELMNKPEFTRTVASHRITVDSKVFNLKFLNIPHGTQITVFKNLWKWQQGIITVSWQNALYDVQCTERLPKELGCFPASAAVIGEEFKAVPETETQKGKKRADALAYAHLDPALTEAERAKALKKATPFQGISVFGNHAEKVGNLSALPKRGTAINLERPAESVRLPIMELFKRLRAGGMTISQQLNQDLRAAYGDSIEAAELGRVSAEIVATGSFTADGGAADSAVKAM